MSMHFNVRMSKIWRTQVHDIRQLSIPVHHASSNRPFQIRRNVQLKTETAQYGYKNLDKYSFGQKIGKCDHNEL